MPITGASGPKDFQVMRQEKTLALAWALQACAKELGAPVGILFDAVHELQRCMAPLMTLRGDDIVETFLMKPTEEEQGPPPPQRRRPSSWVRESNHCKSQVLSQND